LIGPKDSSDDTFITEEITCTKPRWTRLLMCIFSLVWFVYVAVCYPPALHNIYFILLWHDVAYLCWNCR